MRRLKWVLTGVVVLLVGVVVAGIAILKSIDLNQYKGLIAQEIEGATGRKVVIGGPIELEVSFSPALALSDVSLRNASWSKDPQMLAVKRFEARVALLPLLREQLRIVRIVLSGADIRLETDPKGTGNWVFQTAQSTGQQPSKPATPPGTEQGQGGVVLPAFDNLTIENSSVTFRDGRSGAVTALLIDKLQAAAPSDRAPMKIDLSVRYNQNPVEVHGTVGALASLTAGQPVAVDLQGKAGGADLRVSGDLGKPGGEKGTNLIVSAEGSQIGDLSNLAGTPIPALGPYKASLRLQETKGVFSANTIQAVVGKEDLMLTSVTGAVADLAAASGINLQVEVKGPSLAALNDPAKLKLPPIGPYQIATAVTGDRNAIRLQNLAATVGHSDLAGTASLVLGGPRPSIDTTLTSNRLELADFTKGSSSSKTGSGQTASSKSSDGRIFPADPLPLDGLKALDGVVRFNGRSLVLEKVTLDNVAAVLTIKDGRLVIDPLKAGVMGGNVAIKADLDGGMPTPAVALSVTSRQVEVGSLLHLLQVSNVLSGGKADLDLNVTGSGNSVRAIMAGLDGTTRLVMGPGRIDNGFAKLFLADLVGVITFSGGGDSSNLNCFVSDFGIAKGKASSKALVLDTNGATIVGSGNIDLSSERLNLRFEPNAKQANLAHLAVPVHVSGTLASPSVTPDPGAIAKDVVGAIAGAPQGIFGALAGLTGSKAAAAPQNPCASAVGNMQPAKASTSASGSSAPATGTEANQPSSSSSKGGVKGVVEGLSGTLNNLLGGGSSSTKKSTN